jgi:hypothetical protein
VTVLLGITYLSFAMAAWSIAEPYADAEMPGLPVILLLLFNSLRQISGLGDLDFKLCGQPMQ